MIELRCRAIDILTPADASEFVNDSWVARKMLPDQKNLPRMFRPKRHFDERGWFCESFRESELRDCGIRIPFVQENQSYSTRAGTIRGLHFQLPPHSQAKIISVSNGRILDVIVDVRSGSPTYGRHVAVELAAETGDQLYVPAGFAHGFVTLTGDVLVTYKVSDYYVPSLDGGIRWNDPDLMIQWPVDQTDATVSDKDRGLPLLKEFDSPFAYTGAPLAAREVILATRD